jgi:hypothetical protein
VRSHFAREGQQVVDACYAARVAFDAVLAHYVHGFTAAGYVQEVMSATDVGEQHRFRVARNPLTCRCCVAPAGR